MKEPHVFIGNPSKVPDNLRGADVSKTEMQTTTAQQTHIIVIVITVILLVFHRKPGVVSQHQHQHTFHFSPVFSTMKMYKSIPSFVSPFPTRKKGEMGNKMRKKPIAALNMHYNHPFNYLAFYFFACWATIPLWQKYEIMAKCKKNC